MVVWISVFYPVYIRQERCKAFLVLQVNPEILFFDVMPVSIS